MKTEQKVKKSDEFAFRRIFYMLQQEFPEESGNKRLYEKEHRGC